MSGLNKFERKVNEQELVRATKGITLFISNEDMDDVVKMFPKSFSY